MVEGAAVGLELEGAEDGVFRVGIGRCDKRFQSAFLQPGVLIQEIYIAVTLPEGVFEAQVVAAGEAQVFGRPDQMHLREMGGDIIGRPVRGIVVHGKNVCLEMPGLAGHDGAQATLQPVHAVVYHHYDKDFVHGRKNTKKPCQTKINS